MVHHCKRSIHMLFAGRLGRSSRFGSRCPSHHTIRIPFRGEGRGLIDLTLLLVPRSSHRARAFTPPVRRLHFEHSHFPLYILFAGDALGRTNRRRHREHILITHILSAGVRPSERRTSALETGSHAVSLTSLSRSPFARHVVMSQYLCLLFVRFLTFFPDT